jgi:YD repeat-containing protein
MYTYDGLQRVVNTAYPDGGNSQVDYGGSSVPEVITTTVQASPSPNQVSSTKLDGLGRTITSISANGATTQTTYDSRGRVHSVSNPYFTTSDPTNGLTTYTYDALNRLVKQVDSDNTSAKLWSYIGSTVKSTDEDGNQWQRTSDALGRLSQVLEPNGSTQTPSLETDYQYDALNDLMSVNQKGASGDVARTRAFTYNGLSELVTSANPETGTVCYGVWSGSTCINGYDADGNLVAKTDPRNITTYYAYDNLNRLISKTFSSNAPAGSVASCYLFDTSTNGIGRLRSDWTQSGSSCPGSPPAAPGYQSLRVIGAYDAVGRVVSEQQCTLGFCSSAAPPALPAPNCSAISALNGLSYCYDLAGNLTAYTNGLNSTAFPLQSMMFSQGFDAAAQLSTVSNSLYGTQLPVNLFGASARTSWGALQNWFLGSKLNVNMTYDNRLRVTSETATHR